MLAGVTGVAAAFGVNAASFAVSALLLAGLGPLAPLERPTAPARTGLLAGTVSGLRYARDNPVVRGLPVALTGPRATFVIGGAGALAGAFVLASALRSGQVRAGSRGRSPVG